MKNQIMKNQIDELSFHGKLIKTIFEHWAIQSLFEPNDQVVRDKLKLTLQTYLPTIDCMLFWEETVSEIDKGLVRGYVAFSDENGVKRIMDFCIVPTGIMCGEK